MNRTRRTALTATIAAAIIGGAFAVVAANAAEPTSSASSTSTPTPSATSSTNPVEEQLRDSVRSLEDELAALELVATLATDGSTSVPSPTSTRTSGSGRNGTEDGGVHQNRNRGGDDDRDDDGDDRDDDADDHGGDNSGPGSANSGPGSANSGHGSDDSGSDDSGDDD